MVYAYVELKDKNFDIESQINCIKKFAPEIDDQNVYIDHQFEGIIERKEYKRLKLHMRRGDRIIISEMSLLGKNKSAVINELREFQRRGVQLHILDLPSTLVCIREDHTWLIDTVYSLIIEILSSITEKEKKEIKKQQAKGIAIAKKKGKYHGRKPKPLPKEFPDYYIKWKKGDLTVTELTELLGYKSRSTTYLKIKQYEDSASACKTEE